MEGLLGLEKNKKSYIIDIIKKLILVAFYFLVMLTFSKDIGLFFRSVFSKMDPIAFTVLYQYIIYLSLFGVCLLTLMKEIKEGIKIFSKKAVSKATFEIIVGIVFCYMANILGSVLSMAFDPMGSNSANEESIREIFSSKYGMFLIFDVCILGPIVEEIVFRGAIQKGLVKLKIHPLFAILIASIIFGFIHVIDAGDYLQVFPYIFMGLALGYTYYVSDSLVSSIAVHVAMNTISTSLQFFLMILEGMGIYGIVNANIITKLFIK